MSNTIISASIMCGDQLRLGEEITKMKAAGVDWIHIDVMDGQFVPNIVNGCPDLVSVLKGTGMFLDVHLMIMDPERFVDKFIEAGADMVVVHAEATKHLYSTVMQVKKAGAKVGVALNPATPLLVLEHVIDQLDMILIMTVEPGFSGQAFIMDMLPKIKALKKMIGDRSIDIQVDGGLNVDRVKNCKAAGANVFVGGTSAIFNKPRGVRNDMGDIIKQIHES